MVGGGVRLGRGIGCEEEDCLFVVVLRGRVGGLEVRAPQRVMMMMILLLFW